MLSKNNCQPRSIYLAKILKFHQEMDINQKGKYVSKYKWILTKNNNLKTMYGHNNV